MNEALAVTLSSHIGRQLFHWVITQSDIWYLAYRCADFVTKIHEPLERGVAVLDGLLTIEDEDQTSHEDLISMEFFEENQENLDQQQQPQLLANNLNNNNGNRFRGK